jgi:hypothetical protein
MTFCKKDSCRRALKTAAIVFAALSLLPAIGIVEKFDDSMVVIPAASAQLVMPEDDGQNTNISSTQNTSSSFLLRGLIGSMISTEQDANITDVTGGQQVNESDYTVTGRWRLFVNESLVQRFVANLSMARTDGSEYHNNIIIESIGRPSEFAGNSSIITAQVYTDSPLPGTIVPIRLEIKDRVLTIVDIDIDEGSIEDEEQRNILGIIDGQSIHGIAELKGTG